MMHIGFITPEYPHPKVKHAAGLGTSISNLVQALISEQVIVSIFVYGQQMDEVFEENGIQFYLLSDKKYAFAKWFLHRNYIQNYINTIVAAKGIQVLEAPDWTGITAFMKFKVPLVIRFHGSDTYFCHLEKRKQKRKNFWFEKLALSKAQAFIAPTTFAGDLSKKLFGIKNKTIQTIPHGLNLSEFENKKPSSFESGLVLYIGTIIRKKGVLELPAIFKKVKEKYPNARLVLIGSDSYDIQTQSQSTWELVQQSCTSNDLSAISYLGKIPYQEVHDYIKKAHVCVFPTFAETLGMVTIESMALQKPVVNSNIGWAKELLVDGESGYLVHPTNHDAYAEKIIRLLEDEQLCLQIGEQARERIEKVFDIKKIAVENIDFYKKVILSFRGTRNRM